MEQLRLLLFPLPVSLQFLILMTLKYIIPKLALFSYYVVFDHKQYIYVFIEAFFHLEKWHTV